MSEQQRRFARFAWGVLAYTVLVIVWGGFVRASGSGAGCGAHWPLCNGEVVPVSPALNTVIELSHRVSSGILGFVALAMAVAAFLVFPRRSPVRGAAVWTAVLVGIEGLIGRGLVVLEYVAYDASTGRAYWMALHLANTFFLLAALTLTAWAADGGALPRWAGRRGLAVGAALAGTLVLGVSGAVTALGDTLAIHGGLDPAEEPLVAALVGLRLVHPLLACAVLALAGAAVWAARDDAKARRLGLGVLALFLVQMLIGLVNVRLMAPVPLQLVHLFVTDLIWVGLVLFAAQPLEERRPAFASG